MGELKTAYSLSCSNCGLQKICFPTGLGRQDLTRLDSIVERKPPFRKGDHLFLEGQNFEHVFAIRAGVVKIYQLNELGDEQVLGFYLPGDVIGLDALGSHKHLFNAVALDSTSVCSIPFNQLQRLSLQVPALNHQLLTLLSKGMVENRFQSEVLSKRTAEQRVAYFLLNLCYRLMGRGYVHTEFRLAILQRDVALFLGLTPETVSRVLSQLSVQRIAHWKRKEVSIENFERLRNVAGDACHEAGLTNGKVQKMG